MVPAFEKWLTDQFKANKSWGEIARSMLTAEGAVQYGGIGPASESKESNPAAVIPARTLGR